MKKALYPMKLLKNIFSWYFSRSALPYWCILALDNIVVLLSGLFCYYFEHGGLEFARHFWPVLFGMVTVCVVCTIPFHLFHTYRGVIRYSSFVDLQNVALALLSASVVVCALHQLQVHLCWTPFVFIPDFKSTLGILLASLVLMWGIRVIVKICYDLYRDDKQSKRVFIYGTLQGGISLGKSLRNSSDSHYCLAGFISAEANTPQTWLLGVKVYPDADDIVQVMQKKGADVLLVSPMQADHFRERTTLVDALVNAGIKILMTPPAEEWDGKSNLSHHLLHEVDIEDLLPREKIEVNMEAIGYQLCGHSILITGAAGSIGSEIVRQVAKFQPSVMVLIDQAETPMHDIRLMMARQFSAVKAHTIVTSICKPERMEEIFAEHRPEYVFHAAAYKHVPMMEDNPKEAVQNNIYGTRVIADLAVKYGTRKFVMVSTDKAVNPTNVMGCSKRICEIYCQSLNQAVANGQCTMFDGQRSSTQFVTTRFGNVLGSNGSVIPLFKEQIKAGDPITVTHPDIIRYFMLIPEACKLVLEAGTMGKGGEIFVFDMGKPVKIVDLARRMIRLSGAKNIEIKFTGLRDGEKLYEEVLSDKETTKPTCHPKIMVAAVREYAYEDILRAEQELYKSSFTEDDMAIVKRMKAIVPEFKSRHSKYEVLDR